MKLKTLYTCQNCGYQTSKWLGRCSSCEEWNSFIEEVINVGKTDRSKLSSTPRNLEKPQSLESSQRSDSVPFRTLTGIDEWDQTLGGGLVDGSLVLLAGEPGIGKSTLTLQIVSKMAQKKTKILLITGEESTNQVSDRAKRLGIKESNIQLLYENNLENILLTLEKEKPDFLVVDSIQVMASNDIPGVAGTLSQVRYVTEALMNHIKTRHIATLLIGHVNKEGNIAGPKVLEHLVDTVILLEGERDHEMRLLRVVKNRFGPVSEVGLFEMSEQGLKEVKNPGERILENRSGQDLGSALTVSMEGNRPLLIEVQALVQRTPFGYPKRMASGFDRNRLELLIAVLQKYSSLNLSDQDVYINVAGGLTLRDPAGDLAVCMAIASSTWKKPIPLKQVSWGEMGLTGEVRKTLRDKEREKACKKMKLEPLDQIKNIKDLERWFEGKAERN